MWRGFRADPGDESLLLQLRSLADQLGGRVSVKDFRRTRSNALYAALLRRFGSITRARQQAGIVAAAGPYKWTRERIVAELRWAHRNGIRLSGPSLKRAGREDLLGAAEHHFGGLPAARAQAGIAPPPFVRGEVEEWTATRVVLVIRERQRRGESLASSKVPARLRAAARVYCGSWKAAIEAAGFDYADVRLVHTRYNPQELLSEIRQLAGSKPAMTVTQFHRLGIYQRCLDEFGSLERALHLAGVDGWPVRSRRRLLSAAETLQKLRALGDAGCDLRRCTLRHTDPHLARSTDRNFASWSAALAAVRSAIKTGK